MDFLRYRIRYRNRYRYKVYRISSHEKLNHRSIYAFKLLSLINYLQIFYFSFMSSSSGSSDSTSTTSSGSSSGINSSTLLQCSTGSENNVLAQGKKCLYCQEEVNEANGVCVLCPEHPAATAHVRNCILTIFLILILIDF